MLTHKNNNPKRLLVANWLLICCGLVFVMVILGGVTRLTGSGLSMVDWRPIMGAIPPLSSEDWQTTFNMYKQSPEFIVKNFSMNVEDFKSIFWLEYLHRLLGRLIGLVFFFPFLYFVAKGYLYKREIPKYLIMLFLGGMQGLLGWYMVQSGLIDNPAVSQYRLTAHLSSAFLIYGFMLWVALSLIYPEKRTSNKWTRITIGLTTLIVITIISGGFVAGLKAGKIYNTYPMMGEYWIPPGIFALEPSWINWFENIATVQLSHRILTLTTLLAVMFYWFNIRKSNLSKRVIKAVNALLHTTILQFILGISTLLMFVPTALAAAHQATAMLLLSVALYLCHAQVRGQ
ncbi:MAG: COX15/CtaA family protein [Pseudomonadota bacterium]|nr:COX15/CtaA family protein [Pseudomonadota bacterium]